MVLDQVWILAEHGLDGAFSFNDPSTSSSGLTGSVQEKREDIAESDLGTKIRTGSDTLY